MRLDECERCFEFGIKKRKGKKCDKFCFRSKLHLDWMKNIHHEFEKEGEVGYENGHCPSFYEVKK